MRVKQDDGRPMRFKKGDCVVITRVPPGSDLHPEWIGHKGVVTGEKSYGFTNVMIRESPPVTIALLDDELEYDLLEKLARI